MHNQDNDGLMADGLEEENHAGTSSHNEDDVIDDTDDEIEEDYGVPSSRYEKEAPKKRSFAGIALAVGVTAAVVSLGAIGYSSIQGATESTPDDVSANETAGTELVDEIVGKTQNVPEPSTTSVKAGSVEGLDFTQEGASVSPVAPQKEPEMTSAPIPGESAKQELVSSVSPSLSIPSDVLSKRMDDLEKQFIDKSAEEKNTSEQYEELIKVITEIKESSVKQEEINSDLLEKIEALSKSVEESSSKVQSLYDLNIPGLKKPAPVIKQLVENTSPEVSGRKRLAGFKVEDSTTSGKLTVVKQGTSGKFFTLFAGEGFGTYLGRMVVKDVVAGGKIVLVGTQYYIDSELQEVPLIVKKQSVVKKSAPSTVGTRQKAAPAPVEPKFAEGLTCNASFNDGKSFGVTDKSGSFQIYNIGQTIPGVGSVKGISESGNLMVGDKLVRIIR